MMIEMTSIRYSTARVSRTDEPRSAEVTAAVGPSCLIATSAATGPTAIVCSLRSSVLAFELAANVIGTRGTSKTATTSESGIRTG